MAKKVFKVPDGKGGIIFQIQTPDGRWIDTDEAGNPLHADGGQEDGPSGPAPEPVRVPPVPKAGNRGRTSTPSRDGAYVNVGVHFPREAYKEFSDYIHWRCLFKDPCTKASFLVRLALDAVRKDREFKTFLQKNAGIDL